MKTLSLLLALGCLLSTAYAQTAPTKRKAGRKYTTVAANDKELGKLFKEHSKPTDMNIPPPVPVKK